MMMMMIGIGRGREGREREGRERQKKGGEETRREIDIAFRLEEIIQCTFK